MSREDAAWPLSTHSWEAATIVPWCFALRTNGVTAQQADCAAPRPLAEVAALQGTSMATPLAAGSAALVRQYFLDGFYPSGAATPAAAFAPSGVLVKAVMLGAWWSSSQLHECLRHTVSLSSCRSVSSSPVLRAAHTPTVPHS